MRDARYGLRGVRVGEATHPGPQGRPRDTSDEVLDNLERELSPMTSHWFVPRMVGMWSPGSVPSWPQRHLNIRDVMFTVWCTMRPSTVPVES